jgi:sugar lactone lactonase YvrE
LGANPNDDVVSEYINAWNGHAERLNRLLSGTFVDSTALLPVDGAGLLREIAEWRREIPDLRVTLVERTYANGVELLRLAYEGHAADPARIAPLSGGALAIDQVERLTVTSGQLSSRKATVDDWTLPAELMFVPPPSAPIALAPARIVASFDSGTYIESIAFSPDGRLFLSMGPAGEIVILGRDGNSRPFAKLPVGPGGFMMCLVFDTAGTLYASVSSQDPAVRGIWAFAASGHGHRLAQLPARTFPNGIALDGHGDLIVADSIAGVLWQVPIVGGDAQVWLRSELLLPRPLIGRFPGANGLQRVGASIVVAVSDRSLVLQIPIASNGTAGAPVVLTASVPTDDFAAAADGTLYLTTHPFNSVVRLTTDGRLAVIAGAAQGIIGPTSAAFAADGALYVATDGGLYRPVPGVRPRASVVRLLPSRDQGAARAPRVGDL